MPGAHSADWRRAFWGQGLTLPTPSCPSSHPRDLAHSLTTNSSPLTASYPGDAGPGSAVLCVWAKLWFPFQPASQKSVSVSSAPATTTPPTPTRHTQAQPNPRAPKTHRFLDVSPPPHPHTQTSNPHRRIPGGTARSQRAPHARPSRCSPKQSCLPMDAQLTVSSLARQ